jgi:hypothetical protein
VEAVKSTGTSLDNPLSSERAKFCQPLLARAVAETVFKVLHFIKDSHLDCDRCVVISTSGARAMTGARGNPH